MGQFFIDGFTAPYRLDRNIHGGGVLVYIREDIPSKQLNCHIFPEDIEGIFVEINLRKTKWLLFGSYHPPSQSDQYYFDCVGRSIDKYLNYDNFLLAGDFNAKETDPCLKSFMFEYDIYCLVKDTACFKNPDNPSCIDPFLTNNKYSFQNITTVCTWGI